MAIINNLCAPALVYLFYSFSQIFIDLYKRMFNVAFLKFLIMIIFTFLLNMLCAQGLGVVSWIIVFIPFMLMSLITAILLYVFGLNPRTGKIPNLKPKNPPVTNAQPTQPQQTVSANNQTTQKQTKSSTVGQNASSSGTHAQRPGENDVLSNTFDSMNATFDKYI